MGFKPQSLSGSKHRLGTSLSEINVTPFIDVMLVLLIIFMITAPMMQSGIGVNLPKAETESAPADPGMTMTITRDQYIHIGNNIVNINLLERTLQQLLAGKDKKVIFIQGDQDVPYGFIIRVMDIVKKTGIETVGLITEPQEKKPAKKFP